MVKALQVQEWPILIIYLMVVVQPFVDYQFLHNLLNILTINIQIKESGNFKAARTLDPKVVFLFNTKNFYTCKTSCRVHFEAVFFNLFKLYTLNNLSLIGTL